MIFAIGNIFLNDYRGLERLLDSARDFDIIYCIDGRFHGYNGPKLSDDGSRELVQTYKNTILLDFPDRMEAPKRQTYFDMAKKDGVDFLLQVDSDEYVIIEDMDVFKNNCVDLSQTGKNAFQVTMKYFDLFWREQTPYRLFYRPETCKYKQVHNQIWANGLLVQSENRGIVANGLKLVHDKSVRTKEREENNKKWYDEYPIH